MNRLTYNLSMLGGLIAIGTGAALMWGVGVALMVAGGLVVALTFITARVA